MITETSVFHPSIQADAVQVRKVGRAQPAGQADRRAVGLDLLRAGGAEQHAGHQIIMRRGRGASARPARG
jgi:hypothetical protein